ncbi:hypothetical protein Micbo1qcDRAFT_154776 [Microdochium bolleyi]|uniref:F-box domain-containing protein n=1 Tax=Microdochium bolleyi TaxID=196109 RepID=A0A136II27_9PEZI|nr:hypothetical protein Micbo1qcDRAFT_154776 [Microdochium bolleyi]
MALSSLPLELFGIIASSIDTLSFFALRQTSRYVEAHTRALFRHRYFSTRAVMMYEPSLQNLLEVSRHEEYRTYVKKIIVCLDHIPEIPAAIMYNEMRLDNFGDFEQLDDVSGLRKQKSFKASGIATHYLSLAFSQPNLSEIIVSDTRIPWAARSLRRKTGLRMVSSLANTIDFTFIHAIIQATIMAIYTSSVQVALHINIGVADESIWPDLLVVPDVAARFIRQQPKGVTELSLSVSSSSQDKRRIWIDDFLSFVNLFARLESLDLGFNTVDEHLRFPNIAQRAFFPHLRVLMLGFIQCTKEDLMQMVFRHKATLKELVLTRIELPTGTKSWPLLLEAVLDTDSTLERVILEECLEGDLMLYSSGTAGLVNFEVSKTGSWRSHRKARRTDFEGRAKVHSVVELLNLYAFVFSSPHF